MKVAIRTDASPTMGFGHLNRCLTLAHALKKKQHEVYFLSFEKEGLSTIQDHGFSLVSLSNKAEIPSVLMEQSPDLLILDHYELGLEWEQEVRPFVKKIMAFEDMPNRQHSVDCLLVQNELGSNQNPYSSLNEKNCRLLLGPTYALLRPEFHETKRKNLAQKNKISSVLIFFGTDITHETLKTLDASRSLADLNLEWHIVISANYKRKSEVEQYLSLSSHYQIHSEVKDMASLMSNCDLAIGAGGFTVFERFCLALPTLAIAIADNQIKVLEEYASKKLLTYLGESKNISSQDISMHIRDAVKNPKKHFEMAKFSSTWVDGLGIQRVVEELEKL